MELVNPLEHPEWDAWVARFSSAQFFHASHWARVLRDSYGHRPVYLCERNARGNRGGAAIDGSAQPADGSPGECRCRSRIFVFRSGARGTGLREAAVAEGRRRGWCYVEFRSCEDGWPGTLPSVSFWGHRVALESSSTGMFEGMESAVRRGVRKAEKSGLKVQFGADADQMAEYFDLHCQTRRRHGLPPQPFSFFKNIQEKMLQMGQGEVGLVRLDGKPIARCGVPMVWAPGDVQIWRLGLSGPSVAAEQFADVAGHGTLCREGL